MKSGINETSKNGQLADITRALRHRIMVDIFTPGVKNFCHHNVAEVWRP